VVPKKVGVSDMSGDQILVLPIGSQYAKNTYLQISKPVLNYSHKSEDGTLNLLVKRIRNSYSVTLKHFFFLQKHGTAFGESDIVLFEAFAIFCGIGIHNTKMYEGACKLMAKQKVALDCLSYHAAANDQVRF
jgi:hypothetical protein